MYKAKMQIETIELPTHYSSRDGPFSPSKGFKRTQKPRYDRRERPDGSICTHKIDEYGNSHTFTEKHCTSVYGRITESPKPGEIGTEAEVILQAKKLHPEWKSIRDKQKDQFMDELSDLLDQEVTIEREFTRDNFDYEELRRKIN